MSTKRKLRRAMMTQQAIGQPLKLKCKIADLPKDARRGMRFLIRNWFEQLPANQPPGMDLCTIVQITEYLIDSGEMTIFTNTPLETLPGSKDIEYEIVPTGKF